MAGANRTYPLQMGSGLRLGRWIVFVFMVFCVVVFSAGIYYYSDFASAHPEEFLIWGWSQAELQAVLNQIGMTFNGWIFWNFVTEILFAIGVCGLGFFIFFRKKDDWFSLYISAAFVFFSTFAGYPASILAETYPRWKPFLSPLSVLAWLGIFIVFYMFPDGRFIPRWTRWVVVLLILAYAVDIIVYAGGTPPPPLALLMVIFLAVVPLSQVYRFHHAANAVQRQQTKWVILALAVVFVFVLFGFVGLFFPALTEPISPAAPFFAFVASSTTLIIGLIPLSIALAVLRYRLWDIDVIVRKTLLYAALTALLGLVYFGTVVLLQELFGRVSSQANSPLAIVISTLLIAALFNPLRRRI